MKTSSSSRKILVAGMITAIFGGIISSSAQAADRNVTIRNFTDRSILYFYASSVLEQGWQEDILGRKIFKPRSQVTVNIDDGSGSCHFDLKAVFLDNKEEVIGNDINVCKVAYWDIGNTD